MFSLVLFNLHGTELCLRNLSHLFLSTFKFVNFFPLINIWRCIFNSNTYGFFLKKNNKKINLKSRTKEAKRKFLDLYFKIKHETNPHDFPLKCIWLVWIYLCSIYIYNPIKITRNFRESIVLRTKLCPQLPLCNKVWICPWMSTFSLKISFNTLSELESVS